MNEGERWLGLFLDMSKLKVTIAGGGRVAYRKARSIANKAKETSVVSPSFIEEFDSIEKIKNVKLIKRKIRISDIDGAHLVIAATNDNKLNNEITKWCIERGKLCNVVDDPMNSNVIFPALYKKGRLQIAVSTGGASPALSKWIKKYLEETFPEHIANGLDILWHMRKMIKKERKEGYGEKFNILIKEGFLDMVKNRESDRIISVLTNIFYEEIKNNDMREEIYKIIDKYLEKRNER